MTDAPERIWIDKVYGRHPADWGFTDGRHLTRKQLREKVEYIRKDLLEAHIGAALEMICSTQVRSTSDGQVTHEIPPILKGAIRALRPDALQALEHVWREARVEGMEQAAAVAKEIADQYVGYMGRIERAIRALIEAERGK